MAGRGRPRKTEQGKVKITLTVDKELHERMQKINKKMLLNVNWSDMINQALIPVVELFEVAIKEIGKGEQADLDKIRFLLQGDVVGLMGQVFEGMKGVEKDIEELKEKKVKKVKGKG